MANTYGPPPTGQGWDEDSPSVSGSNGIRGNAGFEIRDLRIGVRIRLEKEHEDIATSGGGGEHRKGSAKAYADDYSAGWPTTRPDGTALDGDDDGRIAIDTKSLPFRAAVYVHSEGWIEFGEVVGPSLLVTGNTTDYSTPLEIEINDNAAADPANRFRFAITAENTLKLQGRNVADNGWTDLFTWVRGTAALTAGAAIAMGSNKITGLAAGTASGDALHAAQVDSDTIELNGSNQLALKAGAATTGIKKTHLATDAGEFVDDVTIENDSTNGLQVKDGGITAAKLAAAAAFRPSTQGYSVTGDGTYKNLDLSAVVGANCCLVFLQISINGNAGFSIDVSKSAGAALAYHYGYVAPNNMNPASELNSFFVMTTDVNGTLRLGASSGTITVTLLGYIK